MYQCYYASCGVMYFADGRRSVTSYVPWPGVIAFFRWTDLQTRLIGSACVTVSLRGRARINQVLFTSTLTTSTSSTVLQWTVTSTLRYLHIQFANSGLRYTEHDVLTSVSGLSDTDHNVVTSVSGLCDTDHNAPCQYRVPYTYRTQCFMVIKLLILR